MTLFHLIKFPMRSLEQARNDWHSLPEEIVIEFNTWYRSGMHQPGRQNRTVDEQLLYIKKLLLEYDGDI